MIVARAGDGPFKCRQAVVDGGNGGDSNGNRNGVVLLLVSGLNIGWSLWRAISVETVYSDRVLFELSSWYIGAIVGSVLSASLLYRLRKKTIYYIGGSLFAVSCVNMIVWYEHHFEAILAGRLFAGIGHGLVYTTTITHAAENVIKELRGRLLSLVHLVMMSMIFLTALLNAVNLCQNNDMVIGILGLVFAVAAFLLTPFMPYESIVFLLRRGEERKAMENLFGLRSELNETVFIRSELREMMEMVTQDKEKNANIFVDHNCWPLFLVTIIRVMAVLTNNLIIYTVSIDGTSHLLNVKVSDAALILSSIRFAVSFVPLILSDTFLHKTMLNYSTAVSGSFTLLVGIMLVAITRKDIFYYFVLLFFVQAFSSFGIDSMQHLILVEAFSTAKKAWSITFITMIEHILQLACIAIYITSSESEAIISGFLICAGVFMVFFAFVLNIMLPETSGLTLMGCRDVFLKRHYHINDD